MKQNCSKRALLGPIHRRIRQAGRRLRGDERGIVAIEFAIVALLFFAIVFAIIELALVFFTGSVLDRATFSASRTVRLGQFQECSSGSPEKAFKTLVCARMQGMMNCEKNLRVDIITSTDFRSIVFPDYETDIGEPEADGTPPTVPNGTVMPTTGGDPVAVRATFYYPLTLPPALTRLESRDAMGGVVTKNRRIITSASAFRNEPFTLGGSCDSQLASEMGTSE